MMMKGSVLLLVSVAAAQDYADFICPEGNGFFPDVEQCDKYYECVADIPETKFCPDGLLFKAGDPNSEQCDYPFNVECGDREFVQEPEPGLDFRCYRANGFFNHESENVCNKYYNCVYGFPHPYTCPTPLVFDEAQGTCVRKDQASSFAKNCTEVTEKETIAGFSCPDGETLGPNGQPLAHPSFRHPEDCRKYIVCFESKSIQEFGCMDNMVFDHVSSKCVDPSEGPADCKCYYECPADCADCDYDCSC